MSKVSFMEIPKPYRRAYLENVAEAYHNDMEQEQPRPDLTVFGSTYYFDDNKWRIIKDEHTGEILCEHDD